MTRIAEVNDIQQSFQFRFCVFQQKPFVEENGAVFNVFYPAHGVIRPRIGYVIDVIVELRAIKIIWGHYPSLISGRTQIMGVSEQRVHWIAKKKNSAVVVQETPYGTSISVISSGFIVCYLFLFKIIDQSSI